MGGILGPLFAAFGPEAVKDRLLGCSARVLITDKELYERILPILSDLPELQFILITGENVKEDGKVLSYDRLVSEASEIFDVEKTTLEDPFIIHYTSGSTGSPKGVVHVHKAMFGHYQTAKWVLDLRRR
jgi:acetyl-CoA synthetase